MCLGRRRGFIKMWKSADRTVFEGVGRKLRKASFEHIIFERTHTHFYLE